MEKDKYKYYRLLNGTRQKSEWTEWIQFFLEIVNTQAIKTIKLIEYINKLYEKDLLDAMEAVNNNNIVKMIDVIFKQPIFNTKIISSLTDIADTTCKRSLNLLEDKKIIFSDNKTRNRKYYYYGLLDLLR